MNIRPRLPLPPSPHLPTTTRRHASILFALSALSNSRETQHFNKITRLPRSEHSPPLKLIQTGEVDPFPLPDKPVIRTAVATPWPSRSSTGVGRAWDAHALSLGRTLLTQQARHTHRLQRALAHAKRRQPRHATLALQDKLAWEQERAKLRNELRVAGVWILGSIATATGLAMWRFWPDGSVKGGRGDMGRGIVADAAVRSAAGRERAAVADVGSAGYGVKGAPAVVVAGGDIGEGVKVDATPRWWEDLFWKQK